MFFIYLRRELRGRAKQAITVALGLAIGIGLVMVVSSASAGVKKAQGTVLHSLYGIGTDITVTKTITSSFHPGQSFSFPGASSRPSAGTHVSRNTLRPTTPTLPLTDVAKVSALRGVAAATGGLVLTDTSFSGTIPSYQGSGGYRGAFGGSSGGGASSGSSFSISSFTVDGIEISKSEVGPLTASQLTKGAYFSQADNTASIAIVSASYAAQESLKLGSSIDVAGKTVKVTGIAQVPSGSADVYLPLGTAQSLSGLTGDVTTIFVSARSATDVSSLASEIQKLIAGSTVATSASLASEVTGSLSSASKITTSLGKWLSIAALLVAFLIAGLLMMSAVSRRVREFGTLKAIGWRTRRIVEQVMGEGLSVGIAGGVIGIVIGIVGAEIITAISPSLTATVGSSYATSGGFPFGGAVGAASSHAGALGRGYAARTVIVHLSAPLQAGSVGLAVLLAIAGGVVAGTFGAWRAARLRPAAALRSVA